MGLGPANRATIARVVAKLGPGNQKIFLTMTHFYPEHAALGRVTARLLYFGAVHTKLDELTRVEPDRTLVSGDVVQNKVVPNIFCDDGTISN
jgi:hypothetical protein